MKNTKNKKQKWLGALIVAGLLLIASPPVHAYGSYPMAAGRAALGPSAPAYFKSYPLALDPLATKFKEDLHMLFTEQGSPFGCLTAGTDHTQDAEKAIIRIFTDQEDAMEKLYFEDFNQALSAGLKQPEFACFQDAFYFNPANYQVNELVRKEIIQWIISQAPTPACNNSTSGIPSSPSSTPTATGTPTATPSADTDSSAPTVPSNGVATAEQPPQSQVPSATIIPLTEHPSTGSSPAMATGGCSLSPTPSNFEISWSRFGFLLLLIPLAVIRRIQASPR